MRSVIITLVFGILLSQAATAATQYKLLKSAGILDVENASLSQPQDILIDGNRILAIGNESEIRAEHQIPED